MTSQSNNTLPLAGFRIIECYGEKLPACARILADLGADVVLIEPPGGLADRQAEPLVNGTSLSFEVHHANKRSVVHDLSTPDGRFGFLALLEQADLLIESLPPGQLATWGLAPEQLLAVRPNLTILSISDNGQTGPWRDHLASEAVTAATSGLLCRSGLPGQPPLLPPPGLVLESTAVQAAWVAMLALWQQARTGLGDWLDFSIREGAAHVLDPALGVTGSAWGGRSLLESSPRGRPPLMPFYPIIPCKGGEVRLCVLNPRQWTGMSEWLGTDHEFTDPMYGNIAKRLAVAEPLNILIGKLFANYTPTELVIEGQRRGVPIAPVARPNDVLEDTHFTARNSFIPVELGKQVAKMASGYWELDGQRVGWRQPAPALGAHQNEPFTGPERTSGSPSDAPAKGNEKWKRLPLSGLRVLDMGVIVAGAEAGRILADMGAETIKVETRMFPDGGRQSMTGDPMTPSIAQGHRNKRSFGVNLRSEAGRNAFKRLAEQADVVLSNFKPGTLESLGIGPDVLLALNPKLVMMDSSALGNTGPLSRSLGYGPLVRASTGLSWLWSYPEQASSYCDGVTIYPDHLAGRVAGIGVLAALLQRDRSGRGSTVSIAQAEVFLNGSAIGFLRESIQPGTLKPAGNLGEWHAPEGLYACAGDDEWCAVSVRSDTEWQSLLSVIDRPDLASDAELIHLNGRKARRTEVEAALQAFTRLHTPEEVVLALQAKGIAAGKMLRPTEFKSDPQFSARDFVKYLSHPGFEGALPTEGAPVQTHHWADIPLAPAPYQGEHTREIAATLLNMDAQQIEALIASNDLEDCETKTKPS
jgi:crotonobetainyl-CoA:carnitine CoA-transferase CaiB-like acyl-CoA transferase